MNENCCFDLNYNNRIILVNFPSHRMESVTSEIEETIGYNPSFSLITLGTWLEFHGYEVRLIDLYADKMDLQNLIRLIKEFDPLFLGCSVITENVNIVLRIAAMIKKECPRLPIVAGGPHASLCPKDMMSSEYIDFVSVQEGESTLLELAEALSTKQSLVKYSDIPGLIYKNGKELHYNQNRGYIYDLDLQPIIKREFFDINRYGYVINFITGRGCPGNCCYCAAHTLSGNRYRTRTIENIFLEIILMRYLLGDKLKVVYFVDDIFIMGKQRIFKFVDLLNKYNVHIAWKCQSRIDTISYEVIDALAENGCTHLLYGIESADQSVLYKIGKNINLAKVEEILAYTHLKNIEIQCSFILGHYCDTVETMEKTYEMVKEIYSKYDADIAIYLNTPYPGTYQYDHKDELGMRIVEKNYDKYTNVNPIVETDNFTLYDQVRIHNMCLAYFSRHTRLIEARNRLLDC